MPRFRRLIAPLLAAACATLTSGADANHSWGTFHWARTANPFTIHLGDNVSGAWDSYLITASSSWSNSVVLNTDVVPGSGRRNCRPTAGRGEVCNAFYGNTGWLGVAQIWASGNHITQGTVKLNDTYFNTGTYNSTAWRNLVMCQEIGHIFGLAHQDENFGNANLGSCMDYTSNPQSNQFPNQHDYQQLETIYSHVDSTSTVGFSVANLPAVMLGRDFDRQSSWGQLRRRSKDGVRETYVREFGHGFRIVTHVFWALEEGGPAHRQERANEE